MKKLLIVLIAPFIFTGVNAVEVQAKKPVLKAATVSADLKFDSVYTVEAINEVHIVNPRLVFAKDVGYGQEVYPFSFDPLGRSLLLPWVSRVCTSCENSLYNSSICSHLGFLRSLIANRSHFTSRKRYHLRSCPVQRKPRLPNQVT